METDETPGPAPVPGPGPQIDRTAPEYVRNIQRFTKYIGHLAGSGATILYAVLQFLGGVADGLAAVAKAHGVAVVRAGV